MRPSQIKQLNYLNIWTVEHLSESGDQAIQNIGPGGREMVKAAQAYLERAKDISVTTKYAVENERLKDEIERVKQQVNELAAERQREHPEYDPGETTERRRPGRPRKPEAMSAT